MLAGRSPRQTQSATIVAPLSHRLAPFGACGIPADQREEFRIEIGPRFPAQRSLRRADIERVAAIMPRPIGDMGDQSPGRFVRQVRRKDNRPIANDGAAEVVHTCADFLHHFQVRPLDPGAEMVGLARLANFEHAQEPGDMIVDMNPIALLQPVAIEGGS